MLITELKDKAAISELANGKTVIIKCRGCAEVHFPEQDAQALLAELPNVTAVIDHDYICNPDNLNARVKKYLDKINDADTLLVLSCGVGVQTVASAFESKKVLSGCDTYPLPGFQGVTPLEYDCDQCGECYLNGTGGICPITACSKSLVNGQCGGCKDGKCEVDPEMECGWQRIYDRLAKLGALDTLKYPTAKVRNFATDVPKPETV